MDFVAIDFETANGNNNSACSMGIVGVKDKEIVETKYYLIQPPNMEFDKTNIDIHGITPEEVRDKPRFPEIWKEVKHLFEDNIVIAHNAQFDMSVLKCLDLEYELGIPDFKYICSIPISTIACSGIKNSLVDRANHLGIDIGEHHNAMDDAITSANIVIETINRKRRKSFESFLNTYDSIPIRLFSELKYQTHFKKGNKFKNRVNISEIVPECSIADHTHIFCGKDIVFTGDLSELSRKDAMQIVVNLGGILKSGVSRKTNYLVVGKQDKSIVGKDGLSSKERRAYQLINDGFDIKVIRENLFYDLIREKSLY